MEAALRSACQYFFYGLNLGIAKSAPTGLEFLRDMGRLSHLQVLYMRGIRFFL